MTRYAGDTVRIVTFASKADGTALVATDVTSANTFIYDSTGTQLATGAMTWDAGLVQWFYNWDSPSNVGNGDFFAKCVLVSTSLNFTNAEWRSFTVLPNPV